MRYRYLLYMAFLVVPLSARADMYDAQYQACNQDSTLEIVECVGKATKQWDKRLNASYKALMQRAHEGQREPLRAAQRLWIKYRDANCAFYAAREGSIRQIESAECLRAMTKARTCEIEAVHRFEAMPDDDCR